MSTNNFLPSKRLTFIIVLLAIVFILIFFKKDIFSYNQENPAKKELSKITGGELVLLDTDEDGLYDWEEALWGTDPNKKDTNGNGVNDKEEVEKRKAELGIKILPTSTDSGGKTETDKFAREMFSLTISLNQKGLLTEEGLNNLSNILGDQILNTEEIENPLKNIKIDTVVNTEANKATYKKEFTAIIEKAEKNKVGGELEILSRMLISEETLDISELSKIASAYTKTAGELTDMLVPEEISDVHKNIIAEFIRMSLSIKLISTYYDDPLISFRGIFLYKKYAESLDNNLYSLLSYFQ